MPQFASSVSGTRFFGNVTVLPWFTPRQIALAGGPGILFFASGILWAVLCGAGVLPLPIGIAATAACGVFSVLCFLLGIRSLLTVPPRGCRKAAFFSFLQKCILFLPAWTICAVGCVFVVGLFCKAWRLGTAASLPPKDCHTAFPDGRKVQVTRIRDASNPHRPLYQDAAGNLYRPPLRGKQHT